MKNILLIFAFLPCYAQFTPEQMTFIEKHTHPKLFEKLQKALSSDYQKEYQEKYVEKRYLLTEKVDKYQMFFEAARDTFLAHLTEEEFKQLQERIDNRKYPSRVSFEGCSEYSDLLLYQSELDRQIFHACVKYKNLLDIPEAIHIKPTGLLWKVFTTLLPGRPLPLHVYFEKNQNQFTATLGYDPDLFKDKRLLKYVDSIVAHELTHVKFGHALYAFSLLKKKANDPELQQKLFAGNFYSELYADLYSASRSTKIAKQNEQSLQTLLMDEIKNKRIDQDRINEFFAYNHPKKGTVNPKIGYPSVLLRLAHAIKIKNLRHQEQEWFKTVQADERYGTAYYERTLQKSFEVKNTKQREESYFNAAINGYTL